MLFHLFLHLVSWNADMKAGAQALILDHEDEGHTVGMAELKAKKSCCLKHFILLNLLLNFIFLKILFVRESNIHIYIYKCI